jgi:hypothetical protein
VDLNRREPSITVAVVDMVAHRSAHSAFCRGLDDTSALFPAPAPSTLFAPRPTSADDRLLHHAISSERLDLLDLDGHGTHVSGNIDS